MLANFLLMPSVCPSFHLAFLLLWLWQTGQSKGIPRMMIMMLLFLLLFFFVYFCVASLFSFCFAHCLRCMCGMCCNLQWYMKCNFNPLPTTLRPLAHTPVHQLQNYWFACHVFWPHAKLAQSWLTEEAEEGEKAFPQDSCNLQHLVCGSIVSIALPITLPSIVSFVIISVFYLVFFFEYFI